MVRRFTLVSLLLILFTLSSVSLVAAQSNLLTGYNQSTNGFLSAGGFQSYRFWGNAGDLIEASLVSSEFDPSLVLMDVNGHPMEYSLDLTANPTSYLTTELYQSGWYELWVIAEDNRPGWFLLTLNNIRPHSGASVQYRHSFDGPAGTEWVPNWVSWTPSGRGFLGPFSNQAVYLTLTGLPIHDRVTAEFDVYVINSWDGNDPTPGIGPDVFSVTLGNTGQTLFAATFSNYQWHNQSYPDSWGAGDHPPLTGALEAGTLGYGSVGSGDLGSSVYHLTFHYTSTDSWLQVIFAAQNLEGLWNESWGIDNVRVFLSQTSRYNPIAYCPNTTSTYLRPGMHVATTVANRLQVTPWIGETYTALEPGRNLKILDGPACAGNRLWWQVEIEDNGDIGWIAETDIYGNPLIARRPATEVEPVGWLLTSDGLPTVEPVHRNWVNVRDQPSTRSGVILDRTYRGEALAVIGRTRNGRWLEVSYLDDGHIQVGWICRELVRENAVTSTVPIVEGTVSENCRGVNYP